MEEQEIPIEHLQEAINEKAAEEREQWTLYVALSTAFVAVLAAIAGLLGGHQVNEALIDQIRSSDQWSYYQAKGIKSEIAASTDKILHTLSTKSVDEESKAAVEKYQKEKEDIKTNAEKFEKSSEAHLVKHVTLSKAVTLFQIAIAISAIAILTRRKIMWYASMVLTLCGAYFLVMGLF